MAQTKVNGSPVADQFLSGTLDWFIIEDVDAATDISDFTTVDGNAESVLRTIATVANPVVIESASSALIYFATEVPGITATSMQTVLQASDAAYANATVTAGTLTVV